MRVFHSAQEGRLRTSSRAKQPGIHVYLILDPEYQLLNRLYLRQTNTPQKKRPPNKQKQRKQLHKKLFLIAKQDLVN